MSKKHKHKKRKPEPILPKDLSGPVLAGAFGSAEYKDGSGRVIVVGYHARCPANKSWRDPGLFVMTCAHEVFDFECHCSDCGTIMPLPDKVDRVEFTNWALQEIAPHQKSAPPQQ